MSTNRAGRTWTVSEGLTDDRFAGLSDTAVHREWTARKRARRAAADQVTNRVETDRFLAALLRQAKAAGGRVAEMDIDNLGALAAAIDVLHDITADTAQALVDKGYSWSDVARVLGVTKQSAWRRFSREARAQRQAKAEAARAKKVASLAAARAARAGRTPRTRKTQGRSTALWAPSRSPG